MYAQTDNGTCTSRSGLLRSSDESRRIHRNEGPSEGTTGPMQEDVDGEGTVPVGHPTTGPNPRSFGLHF